MARSHFQNLLLVLLLIMVPTATLALDLGGHDRDGVVIGLDLGHGWNSVQFTDTDGVALDTGDISTFTGAFRVGWARNDNLVGFVGISGWKRSNYQSFAPASTTNLNFLAEVYYYPRGEGFWVKGGIGSGSIDFYVNTAATENRINFKEGGFTYSLGAGYEFRASDALAFGISYSYTDIDMGSFGDITAAGADSHFLAMSFNFYQP
ncbi:MAG: outer membrane beta-barrel protein [Candidatus Krumholzibacteria bacterium]|nr:outer membrane beta-barrel protein [Candidatus Krumholzibacteria bacterium]